MTDSLTIEEATVITKDLEYAILTEMTSGQRVEPKFAINRTAIKIVRDLIDTDQKMGIEYVLAWKGHLDCQSKSTHNDWSFEDYQDHRFTEMGGM